MNAPCLSTETPIERIFRSRYLTFALLALFILLFAGIRYRLRALPLERDEGEYAYIGQLLLQHIPPFRLAYSMKLPGTGAAYAVLLALFGQSASGIHFGFMLVNVIAILLVYLLGARLPGPLLGLIAGVTYALLSIGITVEGFAAHATHFVVPAVLAATLLLLRAIERNRAMLLLLSGVLFGAGYVMKQQASPFIVFGALYLVICDFRSKASVQRVVQRQAVYWIGAALPYAVVCLLLWHAGVFRSFWFWTFSYASQYVSANPVWPALRFLRRQLPVIVFPAFPMWWLALLGLSALIWKRRLCKFPLLVVSFLVFSGLAVCPGWYFRLHYFVLLLPAVSLLAGLAILAAVRWLYAWKQSNALAALPLLLFAAAFAWSIFYQREVFFRMSPVEFSQVHYYQSAFSEAQDVAAYIREHTNEDARIAVLGSEPEIYFYSHRHSATGYIYMYPLIETHKYAGQMQADMIREIETSRPEIVVFVDTADSWIGFPGHPHLIDDWIPGYLSSNYARVTIPSESATETNGASSGKLRVYKRNATW